MGKNCLDLDYADTKKMAPDINQVPFNSNINLILRSILI